MPSQSEDKWEAAWGPYSLQFRVYSLAFLASPYRASYRKRPSVMSLEFPPLAIRFLYLLEGLSRLPSAFCSFPEWGIFDCTAHGSITGTRVLKCFTSLVS